MRRIESYSSVIVMSCREWVTILNNSFVVEEGCGFAILWGDGQPDVPLIQPRLIEGTATPRWLAWNPPLPLQLDNLRTAGLGHGISLHITAYHITAYHCISAMRTPANMLVSSY
jgi:hypothetical protein